MGPFKIIEFSPPSLFSVLIDPKSTIQNINKRRYKLTFFLEPDNVIKLTLYEFNNQINGWDNCTSLHGILDKIKENIGISWNAYEAVVAIYTTII